MKQTFLKLYFDSFFVKFGSDFLANQSIAVLKRDTFRKVVANSADKKPSNLQTKVVLRKENASSTDLLRPKGIISSRKTNRDNCEKTARTRALLSCSFFLLLFSNRKSLEAKTRYCKSWALHFSIFQSKVTCSNGKKVI